MTMGLSPSSRYPSSSSLSSPFTITSIHKTTTNNQKQNFCMLLLLLFSAIVFPQVATQNVQVDIISPRNGQSFVKDQDQVLIHFRVESESETVPTAILYLSGQEATRVALKEVKTVIDDMPLGAHEMTVAIVLPGSENVEKPPLIAMESIRFGVVDKEEWMALKEVDDPGCLLSQEELEKQLDDAIQLEKASLEQEQGVSILKNLLVHLRGREDEFVSKVYMNLARMYARRGQGESAIMCVLDAIRCDATNAEAHASLATWIPINSKRIARDLREETRFMQTAARLHWIGGSGKVTPLKIAAATKEHHKPVVALMTCATGKYARYVPALIATAEVNFLRHCCTVKYFVFTDSEVETDAEDIARAKREGRLHIMPKEDEGWPYGSLMRVHSYHKHLKTMLSLGVEYMFATDVDVSFANPVGSEILGDRVSSMHPDNVYYSGREVVGHIERAFPMTGEHSKGKMYRQNGGGIPIVTRAVYDRTDSTANMRPDEGIQYYAGGFYGCSARVAEEMLGSLVNQTDADEEIGALAMFHDESHLNRYFANRNPDVVLSPGYIYPEPNWMNDPFCYPGPACLRDEMHPWLFTPWRPQELNENQPWVAGMWNGQRRFQRRILNLTAGGMTLKRSGEVAS